MAKHLVDLDEALLNTARAELWRNALSRVVAGVAVSRPSTSAVLPEGANPTTARPCSSREATAEARMVDLPVPAGRTPARRRGSA